MPAKTGRKKSASRSGGSRKGTKKSGVARTGRKKSSGATQDLAEDCRQGDGRRRRGRGPGDHTAAEEVAGTSERAAGIKQGSGSKSGKSGKGRKSGK